MQRIFIRQRSCGGWQCDNPVVSNLMKGQLISAPDWVLKQNSSPQKRKAAILHPQLMSLSLCYHPTICHSTSYASCHNSCFSFSDMFLATCFSPPGVWQDYEVQKSPASFCFEAWKWSFASSFVSRCPSPTSSHQPSHKAQLAFLFPGLWGLRGVTCLQISWKIRIWFATGTADLQRGTSAAQNCSLMD